MNERKYGFFCFLGGAFLQGLSVDISSPFFKGGLLVGGTVLLMIGYDKYFKR